MFSSFFITKKFSQTVSLSRTKEIQCWWGSLSTKWQIPESSRAVCSFTFVCCCLHGHRQLHDVVHPLRVAHLPGLAALRALLHQEPENITGVFRTHRVPLKGILHQITSVAIIKMTRKPKGCWLF